MSEQLLPERVSVLMGALIKAKASERAGLVYNHKRWEWELRSDGSLLIRRGRGTLTLAGSCIPASDSPKNRERLYQALQQLVRDLSRRIYMRFCLSHVEHHPPSGLHAAGRRCGIGDAVPKAIKVSQGPSRFYFSPALRPIRLEPSAPGGRLSPKYRPAPYLEPRSSYGVLFQRRGTLHLCRQWGIL